MEKTEQEQFVDAVLAKDNKIAYQKLESILKKKCAKKILDTLKS